jgi:flagellar basal body P-ring formation protein FlgA
MRPTLALLAAAWLLLAGPVATASVESPESIRDAARAHLESLVARTGTPPEVEMGRVDPRLRLAACDRPLDVFLPPGMRHVGNVTVGVRCTGASPWTVFVAAAVRLYRTVLVLDRPLPRGASLTAADLRTERRDVGGLSQGYLEEPAAVLGKELRSPLGAGFVLHPGVLAAPVLVRRGERVTLLARSAGFEVRSQGLALEDGEAGGTVRIRNLGSARVVQGRVAGPGVVVVPM